MTNKKKKRIREHAEKTGLSYQAASNVYAQRNEVLRVLRPAIELPELWRDQFLLTRHVAGHGLCGVQRFAFSCGLLVNLRFDGLGYFYDARYCYPGLDAVAALIEWDGTGDPPGEWIKEKVSGRRRDGSTDDE